MTIAIMSLLAVIVAMGAFNNYVMSRRVDAFSEAVRGLAKEMGMYDEPTD